VLRCPLMRTPGLSGTFSDGASGTRTRDLLIANQALSQLSYSPGTGESSRSAAGRPETMPAAPGCKGPAR
jgi:hypothetical protein